MRGLGSSGDRNSAVKSRKAKSEAYPKNSNEEGEVSLQGITGIFEVP